MNQGSLPPPLSSLKGWPWTETAPVPKDAHHGWPRLTIVTPSFNQGDYIEETIRSVLAQNYPNLEYIVMDGGSTDQTLAVLKHYSPCLSYWESRPDRGQAHAINKGFARATGELLAWQNADDTYLPLALQAVGRAAHASPSVEIFYGDKDYVRADGAFLHTARATTPTPANMVPWPCIFSETTFIRPPADQTLRVDESFDHYMDFELFWRLALKQTSSRYVPELRSTFRQHQRAKSSVQGPLAQREAFRIYLFAYAKLDHKDPARPLLRNAMQQECLNDWGAYRFKLMRRHLSELVSATGLRALTAKLALLATVSFLPSRWVRAAKTWIH